MNLALPALAHVALTVSDVEGSVEWYRRLVGAEPVLDEDTGPFRHVVFALGDTLLGLHSFPHPVKDVDFDERRPGLDHVAFGVGSRADLLGWMRRLDELGVPHGAVKDAPYGSGLSFRDPDGIALELFAPPEPVVPDGHQG